ncbi:MAG: trehalose-phosphatase, partial [Candidatus Omnitrophica bacterium]|nr:trehalose-phosphatase [Candidatus Omnitrophota bacterium]
KSRGIELPFGDPSDSSGKETVCGLGNSKNEKFVQYLQEEGAEVFQSTVDFIKELRKQGIKIGIASSSKNCQPILQSVGIEDMFQTRVDGVVSAQLGLKGKPEGDIFLKAAMNLGVSPDRAVVVEDASSGVKAGRNGGFGLVIGIAREDNVKDLFENGADIAVKDMSAVSISWVNSWFEKRPRDLFKFWDYTDESVDIAGSLLKTNDDIEINPSYLHKAGRILTKDNLVVFLDYDGTLTPIVDKPELAVLSDRMRGLLIELSQKCTVAIVSGRGRSDVESLVKIEGMLYAGSHGFDIKGSGLSMVHPKAKEAFPLIQKAVKHFQATLSGITGLLIEQKDFSLALHYRLIDESKYLSIIKNEVENFVAGENSLKLLWGKKVFEILPDIDWNKGFAVRWILNALGLSFKSSSIIYIGDDTTDEDAFRILRSRGCGILVSKKLKSSCADFWLKSPADVESFFELILKSYSKDGRV